MSEQQTKLGQEPAFPISDENLRYNIPCGMSKRFYAACAVMQGLVVNHTMNSSSWIVEKAYQLADELLKQEEL